MSDGLPHMASGWNWLFTPTLFFSGKPVCVGYRFFPLYITSFAEGILVCVPLKQDIFNFGIQYRTLRLWKGGGGEKNFVVYDCRLCFIAQMAAIKQHLKMPESNKVESGTGHSSTVFEKEGKNQFNESSRS